MGIREHFCPKHLLSKTCKRKVNTDWLFWLPPPTLIVWPEWLRFWVSDVCCQMQKYWRLSQKRLNVHVNKDSSNSLYAEDILLFLKLELIRSISTGVKKRRNCKEEMLESLAFSFPFFQCFYSDKIDFSITFLVFSLPDEATPLNQLKLTFSQLKLTWHKPLYSW